MAVQPIDASLLYWSVRARLRPTPGRVTLVVEITLPTITALNSDGLGKVPTAMSAFTVTNSPPPNPLVVIMPIDTEPALAALPMESAPELAATPLVVTTPLAVELSGFFAT